MQTPLVSIIIPTYNRAHLIGETLDSVLAQTYTNWECIVVDDGSNDGTDELMASYCERDSRFQYHHRPEGRLKGGNAARNYGFELSRGEFIQWFDSDDLMVCKKLELKIKAILSFDVDFVISKTKYFNRENFIDYEYNYKEGDVNFESYSTSSISWFTPDLFIKRNIASLIKYNEKLRAGQEYNFCCKLLLVTNKIHILNHYLTLRRDHELSIGKNRQENRNIYLLTKFYAHWYTYIDLNENVKCLKFKEYSLLKCIMCYLENDNIITLPRGFNTNVRQVFFLRGIFFILAIISKKVFGKYYFFYSKLKR